MNVGQLKKRLQGFNDDTEIIGLVSGHYCHARDVQVTYVDQVSNDGTKSASFVVIGNKSGHGVNYNYGKGGHLFEFAIDVTTAKQEVLRNLADVHTKHAHGHPFLRFTPIHGDYRIYLDHGGSQDTCYGTTYDPRIFTELESHGLVSFTPSGSGVPNVEITAKGLRELGIEP